jgi:hypothetical protein
VDKTINTTLTGMREAGLVVNTVVATGLIRSIVQSNYPALLGKYGLGRRWCGAWMKANLNWSYRKGTTSGQKLPANWQQQCEDSLKRTAIVATTNEINHPSLILNWDPNKFKSLDLKRNDKSPLSLDPMRWVSSFQFNSYLPVSNFTKRQETNSNHLAPMTTKQRNSSNDRNGI